MHTQELRFTKWVVLFMMMVLTTMACIFSGVSVDEDSIEISVTISESKVNGFLRYSFVGQDEDNLLDDISSIDMQPDLIRIFGTYTHTDGSEASGSADVSFSVADGMLNAEITSVDIAGLDINHPRVTHINEVMTKAFVEDASEAEEVEFVSVDITSDAMELTIRVSPFE